MFAYVGEHLVPRLETPYPTDLSPESCGMLSTLCLSQVLSMYMPQPKRQPLYTHMLCNACSDIGHLALDHFVSLCFGEDVSLIGFARVLFMIPLTLQ